MSTPKIVIKKYSNRRLYDTDASCYVNVDDVARMIRDGQEIQVVDAKTGEDLTRLVLTQIILDEARQKKGGLPLEFLRQLVVASDRAVQDVFTGYLGAMGEAIGRAQQMVNARREEGWGPFAAMQHLLDPARMMDPSAWFRQPGGAPPGGPPSDEEEPLPPEAPPPPEDEPPPADEEPLPEGEPPPPEEAAAPPEAAPGVDLAAQLAAMQAQIEALTQQVAARVERACHDRYSTPHRGQGSRCLS